MRPDCVAVGRGVAPIWTYRAFAGRVARLAGGLAARHGLVPGDRVAVAMANGPDYPTALFAAWWAGLAAVPVNAKLHRGEFAHILAASRAKVVLASGDMAETLTQAAEEAGTGARVVDLESADGAGLTRAEAIAMRPGGPDDLAWLFYTSGTTGRPKGAMLSHRNLMAMTLGYFAEVDRPAAGDAIVHAAPMSHGSGLYILPHVAAGAANLTLESGRFDPAEICALAEARDGLCLFAAPTMVKRLTDHARAAGTAAPGLKTVVYGGGPMYVPDIKAALDRFGDKFVQIYGQGESPMTITCLPRWMHRDRDHPDWETRLASVGYRFPMVDVAVLDEAGQPLPPGEVGEIAVRGDTVMLGYLDDEGASARALRGGWLHTGDMGVLDASGLLTLKDRSKDLIISGGTNIYPREVEEVLLRHPSVRECAVVGCPHPDWGEAVTAFLVVEDGFADTAALDAFCLEHMARFKRPKTYRLVDSLPKNNYGKVVKTTLRAPT